MKRAVAFLDVLGFRQMVMQTPATDLGPKFVNTMRLVLQAMNRPLVPVNREEPRLLADHPEGKPFCLSYAFSDSVILISHDSSRSSCLALVIYALRVMQIMLAAGFPGRCAASFGEMFVDIERSVFLGSALTTAYDLEQSQDWIGGVVDDSLKEVLPELFDEANDKSLFRFLFPVYRVPMKVGEVKRYRTFNWRWNLIVKKGTKSLFKDSSDWRDYRKVENALKYAQWVRAEGLAYPQDPNVVPMEVRTFYVSDGPPPPEFVHGDEF